jgi:hypothetical protein
MDEWERFAAMHAADGVPDEHVRAAEIDEATATAD